MTAERVVEPVSCHHWNSLQLPALVFTKRHRWMTLS